jgi:hypothetical protein
MTMRKHWRLVLCLVLTVPAGAQTLTRQNLAEILGFENGTPGAFPAGWSGSTDGTVVTDCQVAHSGNCPARFERTASVPGPTPFWTSRFQSISWAKRSNGAVLLKLKTSVAGTTYWTQYSITLPLNSQATQLYIGVLLGGTGTEWVDDLQLLVDGQPVADAPSNLPAGSTGDHQVDGGSGITITSLSNIQIKNLATLAKVWGFLKYHHPAVTSGQHQWDYDLFRALPAVLAAGDGPTANQAIAQWIAARLGTTVAPCSPCATLDTSDLYMGPDLGWLSDQTLLGSSLSQTLQSIYVNRTPAAETFFVSPAPGVFNPVFQHELRGAGTIICTKLRQKYFKHEVRECSSSPDESCGGGRGVLPFGTLSL